MPTYPYTRRTGDSRAPVDKPFPAKGPVQLFTRPTSPPPDPSKPYMWLGGKWVLMAGGRSDFMPVSESQAALDRILARIREDGPPDEPRDDKGEWTSGGGGSDTTTADHMDGAAFASKLDGFGHGGLTTSLMNRTETQGDYARVWLNVTNKSGDTVGQATVVLNPANSAGERTAEFESVHLLGDYQNQGFGSALSDHVFGALRDGGVSQVRLDAAGTGGYAWARQGFTWTGDAGAAQQSILAEATSSGRFDSSAPGAAEFASRVASGSFSSEAEMAAFGVENAGPGESWIGKSVMMGSSWSGSRAP